MYCTRCGKLNPDGARFCIACGAPMAAGQVCQDSQNDAAPKETKTLFEVQPQPRSTAQPSSTDRPQSTPPQPQNPSYANAYAKAYAAAGSHPKKNDRGIVVALCLIGSIALIGIGLFAANVLLPKAPQTGAAAESNASSADAANAAQGDSSNTDSASASEDSGDSANDNQNKNDDSTDSDPSSTSSGFNADVHADVPGSASNGSSGSGKVVPSAQTGANGYILPDAATHTYTREELASLSSGDIQLAVNELLARHGREFNTPSIRDYFESKSWYQPQYAPQDFDAMPDPLNSTEQANYNLLIELRSGQ